MYQIMNTLLACTTAIISYYLGSLLTPLLGEIMAVIAFTGVIYDAYVIQPEGDTNVPET